MPTSCHRHVCVQPAGAGEQFYSQSVSETPSCRGRHELSFQSYNWSRSGRCARRPMLSVKAGRAGALRRCPFWRIIRAAFVARTILPVRRKISISGPHHCRLSDDVHQLHRSGQCVPRGCVHTLYRSALPVALCARHTGVPTPGIVRGDLPQCGQVLDAHGCGPPRTCARAGLRPAGEP